MPAKRSVLCVDLGTHTIKVAEFQINETETLILKGASFKPVPQHPGSGEKRERAIVLALRELEESQRLKGTQVNVTAPAFETLSRFLQLPPVDEVKISQMIRYEIQQNIPLPLDELVCDHQILAEANPEKAETKVWVVALKTEAVENLFRTFEASGLRPAIVDASQAALCNAFRFNYADLPGCSMLLEIGARTTNLLILDREQFYSRTINIGAHNITQEFAAESKLSLARAEEVKVRNGFVGLGGAFEEPDHPHQAALAKIARQVLTRLHLQVKQTIQFYCAQLGGSAPERLFLAGGGANLVYTEHFFAEKFNLPVHPFDPLRNLEVAEGMDAKELARMAPLLGEVVGLGLRSIAECPVELNLIPKSIRKQQEFDQKKPYFIASILSLILMLFVYGFFFERLADIKHRALAELTAELTPLQAKHNHLQNELSSIHRSNAAIAELSGYLKERVYWGDLLTETKRILMQIELNATEPGKSAGLWIEKFGKSDEVIQSEDLALTENPPVLWGPGPGFQYRRPVLPFSTTTGPSAATNILKSIPAEMRAVNLNTRGAKTANAGLAYLTENEFRSRTNTFSPQGTKLSGELEQVDDSADTFGFGMTFELKDPIRL